LYGVQCLAGVYIEREWGAEKIAYTIDQLTEEEVLLYRDLTSKFTIKDAISNIRKTGTVYVV